MRKLIYIASSAHSGSTLLELMLSGTAGVCGLGETWKLIRDETRPKYTANAHERICSCGSPIDQCALWSRYLKDIEQAPTGAFAERYATLMTMAGETSGCGIAADSSKYLVPLRAIEESIASGALGEIELFVVHLMKDVRSFAMSMKRRHKTSGRGLRKWFRRWHRDNLAMQAHLVEQRVPHIQIGYEELCFRPTLMLRLIGEAAGLTIDASDTSLRRGAGHIGVGNPMRSDTTKSSGIQYDSRWFHEPDILRLYLRYGTIRRFNDERVYQHVYGDRAAKLFTPREE